MVIKTGKEMEKRTEENPVTSSKILRQNEENNRICILRNKEIKSPTLY